MASLKELYTYYCRRCDCRPNSAFCAFLDAEYERQGNQRILRTIDVSDNFLGKKGIIPVLDLAKNIKTVEYLDVSNNRLEHEELEHLVYCLLLHPSIHTIILRNNCLHDGSIDHIVKLLEGNPSITEVDLSGNTFLPASLALVDECLARNAETKARLMKEERELAAYRAEISEKRASFSTRVEATLSEDDSGGYLHFATWWRNPQYHLCVSRRTRVSLSLKVAQSEPTQGTLQVGLVVLRFDGVRRVIEMGPRTVVAESAVTAEGHCCLEVEVCPTDNYVVMPFTFRPGRAMDYTITATLLLERTLTLQEEGWVTLDLLDAQYDWHQTTLRGAWTAGVEAGGCSSLPTWRYNPMFRLSYSGKQKSYFWAAPAEVHLLLYKAVDADDNDEKEIGLDVVEHDPNGHGRPPLMCSHELVRCRHPHQRSAAIATSFTVTSSSLDLFVVPSTKMAGRAGNFTLEVFSTVPFDATPSHFPHGWHHRVVAGEWNEEHCGGAHGVYASWKNNLSYKVLMAAPEDEEEAAAGGASRRSLVACLEVLPGGLAQQSATLPACAPEEEEEEEEVEPEEARVRSELAAFKARHSEERVEVCVAAVADAPPAYPVRCGSAFSDSEAQLLVPDASAPFLLVPMTRHAGQMARYRLHLFSATPFLVAGEDRDTLVDRERAWQLSVYASENEARRSQAATADSARDEYLRVLETRLPELREAATRREEIVQRCMESGTKFSDRDFPRGASSLWLDPEAKPPFDFPKEYTWQRVSELCEDPVCLRSEAMGPGAPLMVSPPFPYGKRAWFASVVNAMAAKPHWLERVFAGYDRAHGVAQFRFFKGGKWHGVTIDDYLPVDAAGQLCMGHATLAEDFFYPLAEKAFAKLHRCYEALEPKVTPELTLLNILAQAMEDVSGGLCTVFHLRPQPTPTVELEEEERNVLWRKLKEASKQNALHALILRSDSPGAGDRKHAGLLPDHLYGVLDARFVEQQRLVKVRNWADGADTVWKGRWGADSPAWVDTVRTALEYTETAPATPEHPQREFWMSFDEVLYYFTELLVTEEPVSRSIVVGNFSDAGGKTYAEDTDVRLRAPQYALQVTDVQEGCSLLELTVGLHRPDARMSITRDKDAVAKYRHAIGMAVLATHDNRRHVKHIEESQLWRLQTPARARDIVFKVLLDPRHLHEHQLTLMPFREHERDADTPYLVSASCNQATVHLGKVDDNVAVRVDGAWDRATAGGPPTCPTWRDNHQYFLYPSESMEVTIAVTLNEAKPDDAAVGFTLHTTRTCRSFLHFDPTSVILHVGGGHPSRLSAQATVTLAGMPERRGMPYVLVPHTTQPGAEGAFALTVVGNKPMRLARVEPRLDWHRARDAVRMRADDGSAGGSPRYPSWRCSPQLLVAFPVARAGRLLVSATERGRPGERANTLGMMLLRGDGDPHFGGTRRRLLYEPEDVVAISEESTGRVELEVGDVGAAEPRPGIGAPAAPLVLVVYTSTPYKEADVELAFYSEAALEVSPVREWKHTALEEGSWELGRTAGGNRRQFASWINNPFLAVATVRPTSLVALLVQYPRASEQPIVKRLGRKKAYLPPPITNPDRRMVIELDLVHHDADLTPVAATGPTRHAETALAVHLPTSPDGKPFILVPVTTVIDQDADYKLFVYADQPIDLYTMEKDRLWYV